MIHLREKDLQILDFIERMNCATNSQIQRVFDTNIKSQTRRLSQLVDAKLLKKRSHNPTDNFFNNKKSLLKNETVFYISKLPSALQHDLLLVEFYIELMNKQDEFNYKILEFNTKFKIEHDDFVVIPDAKIVLSFKDVEYEFWVELENNKSFNWKKYYALECREYFSPPIIVISDRRIYNHCKYLELIKIKLNNLNVKFVVDYIESMDSVKYYKNKSHLDKIVINLDNSSKPPF